MVPAETSPVLIQGTDRYEGLFVALASMADRTVVASGQDMLKVFQEAQDLGIAHPIVFHVPSSTSVNVY